MSVGGGVTIPRDLLSALGNGQGAPQPMQSNQAAMVPPSPLAPAPIAMGGVGMDRSVRDPLARAMGYTGDFGGGGFTNWRNANPEAGQVTNDAFGAYGRNFGSSPRTNYSMFLPQQQMFQYPTFMQPNAGSLGNGAGAGGAGGGGATLPPYQLPGLGGAPALPGGPSTGGGMSPPAGGGVGGLTGMGDPAGAAAGTPGDSAYDPNGAGTWDGSFGSWLGNAANSLFGGPFSNVIQAEVGRPGSQMNGWANGIYDWLDRQSGGSLTPFSNGGLNLGGPGWYTNQGNADDAARNAGVVWDQPPTVGAMPGTYDVDWSGQSGGAGETTASVNDALSGFDPGAWDWMAKGGPVRGPGTTTSDSVKVRLSNHEHVVPADEIKALGNGDYERGHKALRVKVAQEVMRRNKAKKRGKK